MGLLTKLKGGLDLIVLTLDISCHILQLNISGWSFAIFLYPFFFFFVETKLENPVLQRQVEGTERQGIR